jgi:alpha-mannosidase
MLSSLKVRSIFVLFAFGIVTTLLSPSGLIAQTLVEEARVAAEVAQITSDLQPQSQAVIQRLTKLRSLPSGTWKMHSGDLAHGEAANLDDSSWQTAAEGSKAPNDAVWFRQT